MSVVASGETYNVNMTFPAGTAPSNWYGVTINYQMDGNDKQDPYNVYLDS